MKGSKNYANAKVYKLISIVDDYFYIGSTCGTLVNRHQDHRSKSKSKPDMKVYKHFVSIGWDNVKIILIDDSFTCANQDQLRREEQRHIDLHKHTGLLLNSYKSWTGMTKAEWQIDWNNSNPERLKEIKKKYRDTHKDEKNRDMVNAKQRVANCQNKEIRAARDAAYYQKNKDKIVIRQATYRENNKDKIAAKEREKVSCDICGSMICRSKLRRHQRSKKCLEKANTI